VRRLWLVVILALPVGVVGWAVANRITGEAGDVRVLRLAHALNQQHPVHLGMMVFAEELARRSGGRMRVDLYADGKLGNERELVELLQLGAVDLTKVSSGQLEAFAPQFALFGLPFLFDDGAHFWRFADSEAGRRMLLGALDARVRGLVYYDAGARSFYLGRNQTRTVHAPADLAALSIRVMPSRMAMELVSALGAKPVPLPFGELYSALDAGVVDGAENNIPSLYTSRQFEVASSLSLTRHTVLPDVLVIGTGTWNRLSRQEQAWVQAAADASVAPQRRIWAEQESQQLEQMRTAGLTVIEDVDRAAFRTATDAMANDPVFADPEAQTALRTITALTDGAH
jgi:tripartite ATP-independent transporter DctP family solute receptor